jgi:hypothetical protein
VSVDINKSTRIFVVGHFDCRGNPVNEDIHRQEIKKAVERLKWHWPAQEVFGLWVNKNWAVERV